jgi:hypothetical protein
VSGGVLGDSGPAEWPGIRDNQDDCLIAVEDGHPVPTKALLALPPWRAVLMARVAQRAGVPLEQGTVDQIKAEAFAVTVTGSGKLGNWWEREA